ncbi:MAG: DNA repair protein RecO [Anaerolineales bacterium]|nr:DNA repair protein RecO [Anaerolineales bacterium]
MLSRRDWGEADRLITLLSPELGKLRVVAPGARKPSSRKSGHLEIFSRGRFVLARGRTFDKITQAETIDYFPTLRDSLERVSAGYLMTEMADRFLQEEDPNALVYDLLYEALGWLEAGEPVALVTRFFELRMLGYVGYQPQLYRCQHCDRGLQPVDQFFDLREGGVLCPTCRPEGGELTPLSLNGLKVLRLLQGAEWSVVRGLRLDDTLADALGDLLHRYTLFQLERELSSVRFIDDLRGSG